MAALGGVVVLRRRRGIRRLDTHEFFRGMMTTAQEEDELIVAAELALVSYRLDNGLMVEPRLAIGGAEPLPQRVTSAENMLRGLPPGANVFAEAAEAVAVAIEPLEDINNTAAYRRTLVRTQVQRALEGPQ
jgi:CO/xanthine dehydrogenase FAD-binding subunit